MFFKSKFLFCFFLEFLAWFCFVFLMIYEIVSRRHFHFYHSEFFIINIKWTISNFKLSEKLVKCFSKSKSKQFFFLLPIQNCHWTINCSLSSLTRVACSWSCIQIHKPVSDGEFIRSISVSTLWVQPGTWAAAQLWVLWSIFNSPNFQSSTEVPRLNRAVTLTSLSSQCRSGFI